MSRLASLVSGVARALADRPDQVHVVESEQRGAVLLEVFMAEGDLGRLIGRQGRTAQALRTLVSIAAEHDRRQAQVEFRDGQPGA